MRNSKKSTLLFGIILVMLSLGVGYAFITTTLSIDGVTDVDNASWNIYWDNVQVINGSVTGTQVTTAPTIDTNKTTVSFRINLKEPGEFYEFTVDAKNDGSLDAMIDTITKTTNVPNYINFIVSYADGGEIAEKQSLKSNRKEKYKIRVEYRNDIDPDDLPANPQSISLSFSVTYIQADSTSYDRPYTGFVYWNNNNNKTFVIGDSIKTKTYYYLTVPASYEIYIKYYVESDIITEAYLCYFPISSEVCLQGGIPSSDSRFEATFNRNVEILNSVYGDCGYGTYGYSCNNGNASLRNAGAISILTPSGYRIQMGSNGSGYIDG